MSKTRAPRFNYIKISTGASRSPHAISAIVLATVFRKRSPSVTHTVRMRKVQDGFTLQSRYGRLNYSSNASIASITTWIAAPTKSTPRSFAAA
jgi:hypothetical protein